LAVSTLTDLLSTREGQILGLAAAGLIDKEICRRLGITMNTLRTYWARIRNKRGNDTRAGLVAAFVRESLTESSGLNGSGQFPVVVLNLQNELVQCKEALRRSKRAQEVLSTFLQRMVACRTQADLYGCACRLFVEVGGYRMAWVGVADPDPSKTIRVVSSFGDDGDYLGAINVTWDAGPYGRGPTGRAVRTGKPAVNMDFLVDPKMAPWRKRAQQAGFESSAAIPLKDEAGVFAVLTIYAPETDAFDDQEISLLETLCAILSYGAGPDRSPSIS
jgi:DNA-binding CsgD family transcriptional regulator